MRRESNKARQQRALEISKRLRQHYPEASSALNWRNPFELLVATILSAQSTDEIVNRVIKDLFKKYPTPAALAAADRAELEQDIYSTGFYRRKAWHARPLTSCLTKLSIRRLATTRGSPLTPT